MSPADKCEYMAFEMSFLERKMKLFWIGYYFGFLNQTCWKAWTGFEMYPGGRAAAVLPQFSTA